MRGYRQQLTSRAAGLVWMVWGLALALFCAAEMVSLLPRPEPTGTTTSGLVPQWVPDLVMAVVPLLAGAVVTNAIWKAHALDGERHRSWIAWAAVVAWFGLFVGVGFGVFYVVTKLPTSAKDTYIFVTPLAAATGAAMISILQARRVRPWAGIAAALLLVGFEFLVQYIVSGSVQERVFQSIAWTVTLTIVLFVGVGAWHYRRG